MEELNKLLLVFFSHLIKLKMFHFQTTQYGAHKAADAYFGTFLAKLDQFMEVAQGIYGRVTLTEINLNIKAVDDTTILTELSNFIKVLDNDSAFYKVNKDLLALRDDLITEANQLKYLLTFR
jgi:hypothetical protein